MTIAMKWILVGRYRPSEHPLWCSFVWRDEMMNAAQEQLADERLLRLAMGTPVMSMYLRAMGSRIGRGVWCETMVVTEHDMITLEDGTAVNRGGCLMTHLFHDRLLRIGPTRLDPGATLGPTAVVLPDTHLGTGTRVSAIGRAPRRGAPRRYPLAGHAGHGDVGQPWSPGSTSTRTTPRRSHSSTLPSRDSMKRR